ncbi:MAG: hypothetical protein AAGI71_11645 [Bacteroidota bacterium]
MAIFFRKKRVTNRRFDYEPRYYNPDKDESIKRRMRLKGRSRVGRRSKADILYFVGLLLFAFYIYTHLS